MHGGCNATQQFTIGGCDILPALAIGDKVNIAVRAVVNGGSQPFDRRAYTVKAQ